ncbi:MAG: arginine N-succinyltransferase [Maricaulaceae bacterium]
MIIVRPAKARDLEALSELARLSGSGFTSLPTDEESLARRVALSQDSFSKPVTAPGDETYLLMLEDLTDGAVIGTSAVKACVGRKKPFFNFKLFSITQVSAAVQQALDPHREPFDMDVMVLVNEFAGCAEVGTLFVRPERRGGGAGRLAAQSRYLFMAGAPERFGRTVLAELRGRVSPDGHSPFWEHLGRKFFRMDFDDADFLSGVTNNQFILDLMPKYPIYVDLLPDEAQAVIGQVHPEGERARDLLLAEGFRYNRAIDIFDGGPVVSAPLSDIGTVRDSALLQAEVGEPDPGARALISNNRLAGFRATAVRAAATDTAVIAPAAVWSALDVGPGDTVRVWLREDRHDG